MTTAIFSILAGFALLAWSADKFIEGAASVSNHLGISQLLIGIVVIGFGTSAPEMLVSLMAAYNGNSGLALGNALGSNIANIGLILGSTAMISPIFVHSKIIQKEIPLLLGMSVLTYLLLLDREVSRTDAPIVNTRWAPVFVHTSSGSASRSMSRSSPRRPCHAAKYRRGA